MSWFAGGVEAALGAVVGGVVGRSMTPHYEDVNTGGANRTAVYGDVVWFNTLAGALLGAFVGGAIGAATSSSSPPAIAPPP